MMLSAVARMEGEQGLQTVARVLCGSDREELLEAGLDELSVYGLLDDLPCSLVTTMLSSLVEEELVEKTDSGCLELTDTGTAVMLGETELPGDTAEILGEIRNIPGLCDPTD